MAQWGPNQNEEWPQKGAKAAKKWSRISKSFLRLFPAKCLSHTGSNWIKPFWTGIPFSQASVKVETK